VGVHGMRWLGGGRGSEDGDGKLMPVRNSGRRPRPPLLYLSMPSRPSSGCAAVRRRCKGAALQGGGPEGERLCRGAAQQGDGAAGGQRCCGIQCAVVAWSTGTDCAPFVACNSRT